MFHCPHQVTPEGPLVPSSLPMWAGSAAVHILQVSFLRACSSDSKLLSTVPVALTWLCVRTSSSYIHFHQLWWYRTPGHHCDRSTRKNKCNLRTKYSNKCSESQPLSLREDVFTQNKLGSLHCHCQHHSPVITPYFPFTQEPWPLLPRRPENLFTSIFLTFSSQQKGIWLLFLQTKSCE